MKRISATAHNRGFSMIELLLLVAIIGILAVIATYTYLHFRKKAMSVEAPMGLNNIRKLEKDYRDDHGTYSNDVNAIGYSWFGKSRYTFDIPQANETGFTARAQANLDQDPDLDVWTINDMGVLEHPLQD